MPNYKEGLNRHQQLLFPYSLDEYVDENNLVRAIDSYVDSIDMAALGVFTSSGSSDGQPAYHPSLQPLEGKPRTGPLATNVYLRRESRTGLLHSEADHQADQRHRQRHQHRS